MLWTGIICAHCSKRWRTQRSCALTSPPSAGIISTPPRTFSKSNLQTHFHLLGQQCFFSLPLATSLALGRRLQTGQLSRFSQVSDCLCFQEIGNSTGEMLLRLSPFLPHALTPKSRSASTSARDLIVLSQDWMPFRPLVSLLPATLINAEHKSFAA